MLSTYQSNFLARVLSWGSLLVTVLVINGIGFDPVNLPKAFLLMLWAGLCLGLWILAIRDLIKSNLKIPIYLTLCLIVAASISTVLGKAPLSMNFYGTYGRNTGGITYICFALIALSAMFLRYKNNFTRVIHFFIAALFFNVLYGLFVIISNKDPFPWNNPYGNFLGTFGNPNFISAFLGVGFSLTLGFFAAENSSRYLKFIMLLLLPVEIFLILDTNSLQGLIVAFLGCALIGFFIVRAKLKNFYQYSYLGITFAFGVIVILGMLQIGPLSQFVYKSSVSIRGEYWQAGIRMFSDSPIWGIGLDSYGDFYRRMRDSSALILPGVNVQTDSAHNVFIDILAGGGLLLFLPYAALLIFTSYRCLSFIRRNRSYDPIFVALFVAWVAHLAQSVISINQIGVAIWGWIFMGLLIAYTSGLVSDEDKKIEKKKSKQKTEILTAGNFITVTFAVLFFLLAALPPALSEYKWRNSLKSSKAENIIAATSSWPNNNQRFIQTAQLFAKSELLTETLQVVRDGVKFDPDFRDYWYFLYSLTPDPSEKQIALDNLKRLDPLNPEYK